MDPATATATAEIPSTPHSSSAPATHAGAMTLTATAITTTAAGPTMTLISMAITPLDTGRPSFMGFRTRTAGDRAATTSVRQAASRTSPLSTTATGNPPIAGPAMAGQSKSAKAPSHPAGLKAAAHPPTPITEIPKKRSPTKTPPTGKAHGQAAAPPCANLSQAHRPAPTGWSMRLNPALGLRAAVHRRKLAPAHRSNLSGNPHARAGAASPNSGPRENRATSKNADSKFEPLTFPTHVGHSKPLAAPARGGGFLA